MCQNDIGRICRAERYVGHDHDDGMLLDIEGSRVEVPFDAEGLVLFGRYELGPGIAEDVCYELLSC